MMKLEYNANALCAVERALGKTAVAIIEELESDEGASLSTLRALLAAGRNASKLSLLPLSFFDEEEAGRVIDDTGIDAVATDVGSALKAYFERAAADGR